MGTRPAGTGATPLAHKGGRFMDAPWAYQLGLVDEVVPEDELDDAAVRWADMLEAIPQLYIKAIKYGHDKAARLEYLEREMGHVNYVWPQQISDERGKRPRRSGRGWAGTARRRPARTDREPTPAAVTGGPGPTRTGTVRPGSDRRPSASGSTGRPARSRPGRPRPCSSGSDR